MLTLEAGRATNGISVVLAAPEDRGAVPLALAYRSRVYVRPATSPTSNGGRPYTWSRQPLYWKRALKRPVLSMVCTPATPAGATAAGASLHWRMQAVPQFADVAAAKASATANASGFGTGPSRMSTAISSVMPSTTARPGPNNSWVTVATSDVAQAQLPEMLREYPALELHVTAPLVLRNLIPHDMAYTVRQGPDGRLVAEVRPSRATKENWVAAPPRWWGWGGGGVASAYHA